jgi:putative peptidoglycan lipid II flippase
LARQLRAGQAAAAMANQNRAIEFGLLFSLPSALALWQLAEPMIRVLFEHGRFGPDDTVRAAGALAAYAFGLPPFILVKALTPGFFAREDTRTPLYVAIVCIVVNVAMNAAFIYGTSFAQVGIALASSLAGWLNAGLLAAVLLHRSQWMPDRRLISRFVRTLIASAGMGGALWIAVLALESPLSHPDLKGVAALAGVCVAGALAYAGFAMVLGVLNLADLRFLRRQPASATPPADPGAPP